MSEVKSGINFELEKEANEWLRRSRQGVTALSEKKDFLTEEQMKLRLDHEVYNINGFPETTPRSWWRAQAFTTQATGTIHRNSQGSYVNWAGYSSPSPLSWYPTLDQGTFSGLPA